MSNLEPQSTASVSADCPARPTQTVSQRIATRDAVLGAGITIRRALPGPILLWWNLVARTRAEIETARADWEGGRFGEVRGYPGSRLVAPELPWG